MTQSDESVDSADLADEAAAEITEEDEEEEEEEPVEAPLATTFPELIDDKQILERLEELGFKSPTEVQSKAIPLALSGGDVIVQAQTGSGKTFAFSIPLLLHLRRWKGDERTTFAVVLAPTRELAAQINEVISTLTDDVKPALLIGGASMSQQLEQLKSDRRIVVGTPGRILDFMRQRQLRLDKCRYFVLDEADEMLSMGFIEDIRAILSRLPDRRQGVFVSATITGRVEMLARSFLNKPERTVVGEYHTDIPSIEHCYVEVGGDLMAKPSALCDIIEAMRPRSAIIFCNTKSDTKLLEALLRRRGFDARRINSDLTQAQRNNIMKKIRAQDLQLLVATDIAARGIDIEQIDLVINYNIHDQPETYIHRTGRTGRAGREGRAISLVGPRDHGAFHFLKNVMDFQFKRIPLPTEEEVIEARLSHLYEMVRQTKLEVSERELKVALKLVHELGAIEAPTEELQTFVAKLCKHVTEHFIQLEAKSLDEELEAEDSSREGKRKKRSRDRSDEDWDRDRPERGEGRRRDDRREGRRRDDAERGGRPRDEGEHREGRRRDDGERRDRHRRDDGHRPDRAGAERAPSERGSSERGTAEENGAHRGGSDRRSRDRGGNERGQGERGHGERGRGDRDRGDRDRSDERSAEPVEVRLYIGQGTASGMTKELFGDLATELGELSPGDLRKLTIREHYGFVDLYEPQAEVVLNNLNGIEYNGAPLPIERAAVLTHHRPRSLPRRQGGGRQGEGRSERGRRDRRRGGGGRDGGERGGSRGQRRR